MNEKLTRREALIASIFFVGFAILYISFAGLEQDAISWGAGIAGTIAGMAVMGLSVGVSRWL